jgi:hypothetical protein
MSKFGTRTAGRSLFFCLLALTFMAFAQRQARADTITFSTAGSFSGTNTNTITFGSGDNTLTLTFTGIGPSTVENSTFASFGTITTSTTGSGADITPGTTLTINITQISPSPGAGFLSGPLNGTLTQNRSTGEVIFFVPSTTIDGLYYYSLINNLLTLAPPSTNGGNTTVQGQVTNLIPEPATLLLFGTGLSGLAAAVRGRRKTRGA